MTEAADGKADDPREAGKQLRAGLWGTINERYPGSMITKESAVPLARLRKPLSESRLTMISSCGVHLKSEPPLDVCHPFGDFGFRRVPSAARHEDLVIHQLKYPHDDADLDINVIFPIERLQEMVADGRLGGLTESFYSFIGYNMDPDRFEKTVARDLADAVVSDRADAALLVPA
ncbi:MAG: glycine/sarcosine/betaine reductase selenoprotein B family protein [Thermoanaerobaculia bacterium]